MEATALKYLVNCEEILEICFWYKGEGFGEKFTSNSISPFVNFDVAQIELTLGELCVNGKMAQEEDGSFRFTDTGIKEAGKLFIDSFNEMQQPSHYECVDGCCDGDDHSNCNHH
jgi:hypothetical protein|tara:strand:+ start:14984 stop:15325 length:342 start_codon:yes stop_codon:yes gene_type:complete